MELEEEIDKSTDKGLIMAVRGKLVMPGYTMEGKGRSVKQLRDMHRFDCLILDNSITTIILAGEFGTVEDIYWFLESIPLTRKKHTDEEYLSNSYFGACLKQARVMIKRSPHLEEDFKRIEKFWVSEYCMTTAPLAERKKFIRQRERLLNIFKLLMRRAALDLVLVEEPEEKNP